MRSIGTAVRASRKSKPSWGNRRYWPAVRRWLAQGKDVTLLGATAPVWVEGSPEMLGRAILNLAENAINHTAAESTVEFMVEDNGTVSVLDYGLGIAGNERNLIFQRFWRRGHRKAGSTGLGLSRISPRASGSVTSRSKAG